MKYLISGALVALTACSSADELGTPSKGWKQTLQLVNAATGRTKGVVMGSQAEQIQAALTTTKGPVAVATRSMNGAWGVMLPTGRNAAHLTYQNKMGQSLTLRNGIFTGSRGFGDDLMSTDTGAAEALITVRREGSANRVIRFLDSENRTQTYRVTCQISRGPIQTAGDIRAMKMTEKCTGNGLSFTNYYSVTSSGRVVASHQWLSKTIGTIVWAQLRG